MTLAKDAEPVITSEIGPDGLRDCFRDPIPEIFEAATLLSYAAKAHLNGDSGRADALLRAADISAIGDWLDPIWLNPSNNRIGNQVQDLPPVLHKAERHLPRDAPTEMKRALVARDGHHCRLCGLPVVRAEVRKLLNRLYPEAARWSGSKASQQHRGLQVLWLQYDHVVVHSRGGQTSLDNIVVTCAACNYGRDRFMMSEVGLRDPRVYARAPYWIGYREWDGLESLLPESERFTYHGQPLRSVTRRFLPA
jgi:5-methylcytosine-specific restriction endonuclease McrA